jgi:K+-sensing histidine kinase KdpD
VDIARAGATLTGVSTLSSEPTPALPASSSGISRRRQLVGAAVGMLGLTAVAAALAGRRDEVLLSTPVLLALSVVLAVAIIGGIRPALPAAVGGFLLLNFVFTQPYGTFDVHRFDQALALAVYLATAVAVSVVVGRAARRHDQALRAAAEATELSALAGSGVAAHASIDEVLSRVRSVFGVEYAAVVEVDGPAWRVVEESGPASGGGVDLRVEASGRRALAVRGRPLSVDDRRVLTAFARAAVASLEGQELARQAAEAARLATIDQLRTTLIAGVGHDLRTPLAGIKAAVTSLRAEDVDWTAAERAELLGAVESSADRLDALVANLLASSRLDAGALIVALAPVDVEEVIGRGIAGIGQLHRVVVELPDGLPLVLADVGLAERIVANLVDNALRHSGRGTNVLVTAAVRSGDVVLSIVDTGPGVPPGQRAALFAPYQRLGDRSTGGLGLGLSVARGFAEAMGGRLQPAETPGGGLTMNVHLRPAPP